MVEWLLVANRKNREWLRIYVTHVIGEYPITIEPAGSLPKWNPSWLVYRES